MADAAVATMEVYDTQYCRLCGELNKNCVSLRTKDNLGRYLCSLINEYLPVNVNYDGKFPQTVCPGCHLQVQGIVEFHQLIHVGQKKLHALFAAGEQEIANPDLEFLDKKVNLTKKKRGRPRKTAQPPPDEENNFTINEEPAQSENDQPLNEEPAQNDGKRKRKAPLRYQGEVQGNELDKVLKEQGVIDEDDVHKTKGDSLLMTKEDSKEVIGHVESGEGTDLGEVSVFSKPEKCAQRSHFEFKCEACGQKFRQETKFLEHQAGQHETVQYFCCVTCNDRFISKEDFDIHQTIQKHVGENIIFIVQQCHCSETFMSSLELQNHIAKEHPKQIECPLCKKKFRFNTGLKSHMMLAHKNSEGFGFPCDICGKKLKHPSSITYHKETEHNNRRKYVCIKCNKVFKHRQLLQRHQMVHTNNRPFKCAICEASFKTKYYLTNHLVTHTKEKKFACHVCDQTFSHKTSLTLHLRWHTGLKPFECEVCKKSFSQKGNLQEHMRIHTGEKPYACEFCLRRFTTSSQYRVHIKSHKGEKPWKCEHCGKAFLHKDTWKTHLRRHSGEKPFMCTICKREFSELWALRKHLRLHTGEKPYKCPFCDKAFADCSNMTKHKRTHIGKLAVDDEALAQTEEPSAFDLWTVFKPDSPEDEEVTNREKETTDLQQIFYITYPDPENPDSKISEKFLMDRDDMVVLKEADEGNQINEMQVIEPVNEMQIVDEQGNPLRFTAQDGTMIQVTAVDGQLQLKMSNGQSIPIQLASSDGETVVPTLRTVDCLPSIGSDAEEVDQNVEGLEFVSDHQDVRLLAGLSCETSLDFLPLN